MKPIEFNGFNVTYAEDQPEYLPLPAHKTDDGMVTTCWKLSFCERLLTVLTGRLYLKVLTFNKPLQPSKLMTKL